MTNNSELRTQNSGLATHHSSLTTHEALPFLRGLPDLERRLDYTYDKETFGLDRMARLCQVLGHPEKDLLAIHVAGTNGKGSTCAFAEAILRACGLQTGLFTSPHLVDIRERIRLNGIPISEEELTRAVEGLMAVLDGFPERERLTFFEVYTALALQVFGRASPFAKATGDKRAPTPTSRPSTDASSHTIGHRSSVIGHSPQRGEVDAAILEVGMGGRLDSTNVIQPVVCGITPIGFDHTRYLGTTLEAIAEEKAGIIKPGVPVVSAAGGEAEAVVEERSRELGAPLFTLGREIQWRRAGEGVEVALGTVERGEWSVERVYGAQRLGLRGRFQAENAACAVALASLFLGEGSWATKDRLPEEAVARGLAEVDWPGRFHIMAEIPPVVLDGAMNPQAAEALVEALAEEFDNAPTVYVLGMSADKETRGVIETLLRRPITCLILTAANNPRAMRPEDLRAHVPEGVPVEICPQPAAALARARQICPRDGMVCVTGSLYLVGEVLGDY